MFKGFNYPIFHFEKEFIVPMQSADAVIFIGNRVKLERVLKVGDDRWDLTVELFGDAKYLSRFYSSTNKTY